MPDKKIIEKNKVKENNPNDDEEILKNNTSHTEENINTTNENQQGKETQKTQGSETIEIP